MFLHLTGLHGVYPPTYSKLIPASSHGDFRAGIQEWNSLLPQYIGRFQRRYRDTFVAMYDTSIVFNAILDDPVRFGFRDNVSECQEKDCMWNDDLHPSFEVHRLLAADLALFLETL
jgi:phospholipase/lecithinase/hemolysin